MLEIAVIVTKAAFLVLLIWIAYTDLKIQRIPDQYVIFMAVLSVIAMYTMPEIRMISRLTGAICISLPMFLAAVFVRGAFGGGDIKLMAAGGLFLGSEKILAAVIPSVFSAGLYCIYLLFVKKAGRKATFPFGPFLCLGMAAALML